MSQNKLKLNADKTEVLVMGTSQMWAKTSFPSITVNGVIVSVLTVNSRKSRTLFINYDFRWLMVAEIY